MAFHIRDKETDAVVRKLAARRGITLTEAVRLAVTRELEHAPAFAPRSNLKQRIRAIQDDLSRFPRTGLKADKAFYDSLSDE